MNQTTNEATGAQPSAKQAWATPVIETHDVAEVTLGANLNANADGADFFS